MPNTEILSKGNGHLFFCIFYKHKCSVNQLLMHTLLAVFPSLPQKTLQNRCLQGFFHVLAVEKAVENVENFPGFSHTVFHNFCFM